MSFSSVSQAPINLTSKLEMEIKSESEELESPGMTAIKRHTIDAILGLPRFCVEEDTESGDLEGQRGKQKFHLERDGESPIWKYHDVCNGRKKNISHNRN